MSRSTKAAVASIALSLVLAAATPVAFVVALFMMLFGHVIGGLAVIGASLLVVTLAVGVAAACGIHLVRSLRDLARGRTINTILMRLS